MKYIHNIGLQEITRVLADNNDSKISLKVDGRCELYSCERIPSSVGVSSSVPITSLRHSSAPSSSSSSKEEVALSSVPIVRHSSEQPSSSSSSSSKENAFKGEVITARRPRSTTFDHSPVPKQNRHRSNSLGSLDEHSSEQVLNAMIGVLNANHDDHDFGNSKPAQFKALTQSECMKTVNKQLGFYKEHDAQFLNKLWGHINDSVDIKHCDIFSYQPDMNDDCPFSDGIVWQFNFFMFNKSKGLIVYFTCIAKRHDLDESFDERTDDPDSDDEEDGTIERLQRFTSGNQDDDTDDLDYDDRDYKDFDGVI